MHKKYTGEEMQDICSDDTTWRSCVKIEHAVLEARVEIGDLDVEVPKNLPDTIKIDSEEILRIEQTITGHNVEAFLIYTSEQLPKELRPHWHNRMTSYDDLDTALGMQLKDSVELLQNKVDKLMEVIKAKALSYKQTVPQMGRTHAVHAEPIDFRVKLANWYEELKRQMERLERLKSVVAVGKISGAVGMYTLDPRVEEIVCRKLGLRPVIATQVISRDIIAEYLAVLANIGGTVEKIATTIRTLQRTEIREGQEYFGAKQRGSSAMPHKRNPIGAENLSGMARVLRGYALTAFENQNLWDERDLTNSGPERIILPDASILLDYMLNRLAKIIEQWIVYPEMMMRNLEITKGLIYSQEVLSLFAEKSGLPREEAYEVVQKVAQFCWDSQADFLEELLKNPEIMKYIIEKDLRSCFNLDEKLKYTDYILNKAFGTKRE